MKYQYRLSYPEGYTEWRFIELNFPANSDKANLIEEIRLKDQEANSFLNEFGWYRKIEVDEIGD